MNAFSLGCFPLKAFLLRLFVAGRHESRITLQRTASLDAGIEALRIRSLQLSLLVGTSGHEPPTSRLSGARSNHLSYAPLWLLAILFPSVLTGGDDGIRTHDPLLAGQVLSQLSYTPIFMRLFFRSLKIEQQSISTQLKYNFQSRHRFDLFAIRHTRENVSVSP